MKKIYSLLAIAALTVGSSVAAPKEIAKQNKIPQTIDQMVDVITQKESTPKKATRAISSVEDIYGYYSGSGYSALQNNADDYVTYQLWIGASKKGGNYVTISHFPFADTDDMEAIVDLSAGTISIAPYQDAWFNPNYPTNYVEFVTGAYSQGNMSPAIGTILENGDIQFDEDQIMGFGLNSGAGYFILWYEPYFRKVEFFSYNEAEWKDGGVCTFEDGWVNTCFEGTEYVVAPQQVTYKESKTTPGVFLLMNPYKGNAWANVNYTPNATGYLYVDASYPDCVCVMPYVGSGYNGYVFDLESDLYFYNQEGVDLADDWVQEDQIEYNKELADENGEPLTKYLSYWDKSTNKITIFNAYFGYDASPLAYYGWSKPVEGGAEDEREEVPIYSYITMDASGVNDIVFDSNAPVKYFNLQGVEVANPKAGELVIKKQGAKAVKMIAE